MYFTQYQSASNKIITLIIFDNQFSMVNKTIVSIESVRQLNGSISARFAANPISEIKNQKSVLSLRAF